MYEDLKALLDQIEGIQFTEYAWATRPKGNHGTYQLDFHAEGDRGDDLHQDTAKEGSLDVYTQGRKPTVWAAIAAILTEYREASWYLSYEGIDQETRLLRREYIFQTVEG